MKKIKKILLLLLTFSFTTLLFNSQAYAVEYHSFEFTVTDVSNPDDVQYTPITLFNDLKSFLIEYGSYDDISQTYTLIFNVGVERLGYNDSSDEVYYYYATPELEYDILINNSFSMYTGYTLDVIPVGSYIIITDISITFTKTFWDQIIDVIGDIAVAFQAAASAGISLIYDGTALTSLGEIITITLGVGLVLGIFYLVIRVLPGARL